MEKRRRFYFVLLAAVVFTLASESTAQIRGGIKPWKVARQKALNVKSAGWCRDSSAGLELVMDGDRDGHSVFTYYLLKALKENKTPNLDASQLYDQIKIPVANNSDQTPIFNAIKNTGDEGGQLVFHRK